MQGNEERFLLLFWMPSVCLFSTCHLSSFVFASSISLHPFFFSSHVLYLHLYMSFKHFLCFSFLFSFFSLLFFSLLFSFSVTLDFISTFSKFRNNSVWKLLFLFLRSYNTEDPDCYRDLANLRYAVNWQYILRCHFSLALLLFVSEV